MNGIAPTRLADMLEKLHAAHLPPGKKAKNSKEDDHSSRIAELLSTHPETGERIREIRNGQK